MERQKPIAKYRAGPVTCALWENDIMVNGTRQTMLKASLERRYKDRDGTWKTSQSFSRTEIPLAIFVLFQAFQTMLTKAEDQDGPEAVSEERVI